MLKSCGSMWEYVGALCEYMRLLSESVVVCESLVGGWGIVGARVCVLRQCVAILW